MSVPHWSLDAERAVLGAILLAGAPVIDVVHVDLGLRPEHFYRDQHRTIFTAMIALRDLDRAIDPLTVSEQSSEPANLVEELQSYTPAAGNYRDYARLVLDRAVWRARQASVHCMQLAVLDRDLSAFEQAESSLSLADRPDVTTSTPDGLASDMFDWLQSRESDAIKLPFPRLNRLLSGGLRRGDVTLVAAFSSQGKSVAVDCILEHVAGICRTHLYINEMSRRDRMARRLARHSAVAFARILDRPALSDEEREEIVRALPLLPPVGITDCSGWPGEDIARHIRRNRWDLCAVDLLNLIPHDGRTSRVAQVDAVSAALNAAARQAECHVLLVCQLNQARNTGAKLPRPVRRDIRESGQLANDAANVLFLHRDQVPLDGEDDAFEVLNDGAMWFDKARNGALGGVQVRLDPDRMRFLEQSTVESGW